MKQDMIQKVKKLVYFVSHKKLPKDISPQDREDAVQEAFVAILEAQSRKDPKKNMNALINIRLKGAFIDFMRQKIRLNRPLSDIEPEETICQTKRSIESHVTYKDLAMQTRIMMYGMEERQRKAVEDYYLKDKNINEVAQTLAVSTSTAWRIVQNGVDELRESMAQYHTNGVNWKC